MNMEKVEAYGDERGEDDHEVVEEEIGKALPIVGPSVIDATVDLD